MYYCQFLVVVVVVAVVVPAIAEFVVIVVVAVVIENNVVVIVEALNFLDIKLWIKELVVEQSFAGRMLIVEQPQYFHDD